MSSLLKFLTKLACLFILASLVACSANRVGESTASANLQYSQKWLAFNANKPGLVQTDSGLQYRVLKSSNNNRCQPKPTDRVMVHYDRRLAKGGFEVDSSYKRKKPDVFPLSMMIAGWQEGLVLMANGEIWEFYIPPHLAYGKKGAGKLIPENSLLISRVHLLASRSWSA